MARRPSRLERRRTILAAARTVFVRRGYGATRVSDIAARAKVGKGTLYEYFGSKEDLFSTLVLDTAREALDAQILPGMPDDPEAALRRCIAEVVRAALHENLDIYRLFFDFWGVAASHRSEAQRRLREVEGPFREFLVGLVRTGQTSGKFRAEVDPTQFSHAFMAAIDGMSMRLVLLGAPVDLDAYTACLQNTLLGGLLAGGRLDGGSVVKDSEGKRDHE
jgi:AcrR family transcriptional regulator